jgi:hypothetical protein
MAIQSFGRWASAASAILIVVCSDGGSPVGGAGPTGSGPTVPGEAITVAFRGRPNTRRFGANTFGVPTANAGHRLSDGAYLWLMSAPDVDRSGIQYIDPIPPDEVVDTPNPPATDDAVVDAAKKWLGSRKECT